MAEREAVRRARIRVRLQPRASREGISGLRDDGVLLVRVNAPPVGGLANEALCRLLAAKAGVPRSHVELVRGHKGREKVVEFAGLDDEQLAARLASG